MIERISSNDLMSQVTVWNNTAYLSGQVALDNREGDLAAQAREIFSRIESLLAEVGAGKSNLLAATIWLTDVADFPAFNDLWRAWIGTDAPPARATVRADLMLPGLRLEIQVVAAIP
ncbi:RidA family protein [Microbaculum marinum]|uniref:RidA family protein n=1 Tax=Microbaculum marinum TaxID=1764581 RepID=A0AAW9RQQ3_9HYPH